MPEICRFWGLIIFMFYDEHNPPHFHARYGEYEVMIDIQTGKPIKGKFPRKQLKFAQDWCNLHKDELLADWQRAQLKMPLETIAPL
jgi:hypothetical protein